MIERHASINDVAIEECERKFHWPSGRRPDDHRPKRFGTLARAFIYGLQCGIPEKIVKLATLLIGHEHSGGNFGGSGFHPILMPCDRKDQSR